MMTMMMKYCYINTAKKKETRKRERRSRKREGKRKSHSS